MKTKSAATRSTGKTSSPPSSKSIRNGAFSDPSGEVLTLGEAAAFLRVAEQEVRKLAEAGQLPAKQFGNEWRILKSALCEWLSKPEAATNSYHERLMAMAGSMSHDDTTMTMLENIYQERRKHPVSELQD